MTGVTITSREARYSMRALANGEFTIRVIVAWRTLADSLSGEHFTVRCASIDVRRPNGDEYQVVAPDDEAHGVYTSEFWVVQHGVLMDAFALHEGRPSKHWTDALWSALAREIAPFLFEEDEPADDLALAVSCTPARPAGEIV